MEKSRRITQAVHQEVECIADLWCWSEHRWKTAPELRLDFDIPRCTAKALVEAVQQDLSPDIEQAMHVTQPLQRGSWVTDVNSLCATTHWSQKQTMLVLSEESGIAEVRMFQVTSALGLLADSNQVDHRPSRNLSSIVVLSRLHKCKWDVAPLSVLTSQNGGTTLAWYGITCKARLPMLVERWRWSTKDQMLLNYHTAQTYWSLIQTDQKSGRDPIPPS